MRAASALPCILLLAALVPLPGGDAATTDPSDPRNFTWEKAGVLAVGGGGLDTAQVDWLYAQGFRAIANFRAEHADPEAYIRSKGMEYLNLPVDHAVNMNATQVEQFVAWAQRMESLGKPVYAHCTNGWHRAAAFAVGYEMRTQGDSYDQAARDVTARRPGTVMRAPAALLEYQSRLRGQPNVDVLLLSPLSRPSSGGTMPATVEALAQGRPLSGASVHVYSEESGMSLWGTTGSDGRYAFTYRAPPSGVATDHLYARATASGLLDGADNVEMFYGSSSGQFRDALTAKAWDEGGQVGVEVRKSSGSRAPARIVTTGGSGDYEYELSGTGRARHDVSPADAPVTVRAEMWGATGARVTLDGSAPPPPPTGGDATFQSRGGNEWWVQVKVSGAPVAAVESRDTGGAWVALKLQSWGDWAGSYHVEPGHLVRFRATLTDGRVVESCDWTHPGAVEQCGATPPPPTSGTFAATFKNVRGNEWWVETDVSVSGGTLAGVDARVDGGAWVALTKQSYGSWAKSIHAASGSNVEFRARSTDGQSVVSSGYRWPPA